jgi:hypothetical protein
MAHNAEHIVTEIKRVTIEQQRFEMRRESKNGIFSEMYLINEKPVSFEEYKTQYLNAKQQTLTKEMDEERQQAFSKAAHEKEVRRATSARLLKLQYDELKAAYKTIKNYELEPNLIWSSSTITSREDYEYATNQLIKEVETLLACPEINESQREIYSNKLKDYTRRLHDLFHNTVNTLINTTKDTKLLKRLMDIV